MHEPWSRRLIAGLVGSFLLAAAGRASAEESVTVVTERPKLEAPAAFGRRGSLVLDNLVGFQEQAVGPQGTGVAFA